MGLSLDKPELDAEGEKLRRAFPYLLFSQVKAGNGQSINTKLFGLCCVFIPDTRHSRGITLARDTSGKGS
jgi:hypothetical protein